MCSNETLKASLDELRHAVRENTGEQQETRSSLDTLAATFETWRSTRCDDHHDKLKDHDLRIGFLETEVGKYVAKTAGVIGAIMIIMQGLSLLFAYLKILPMIRGPHG